MKVGAMHNNCEDNSLAALGHKERGTGREVAEVPENTGPEGVRRDTRRRSDMQDRICTEYVGLYRAGGGLADHQGFVARLGVDDAGDNK